MWAVMLSDCYLSDRRTHQDANLPGSVNSQIIFAIDPCCKPLLPTG